MKAGAQYEMRTWIFRQFSNPPLREPHEERNRLVCLVELTKLTLPCRPCRQYMNHRPSDRGGKRETLHVEGSMQSDPEIEAAIKLLKQSLGVHSLIAITSFPGLRLSHEPFCEILLQGQPHSGFLRD